MDEIMKYIHLDITDLPAQDIMKIISLPESWQITIIGSSVRIPERRYDAVIHHLNRSDL